MQIKKLGSNITVLRLANDSEVLFSYKTPVAFWSASELAFYRTSKAWSRTTSKHINQWLEGRKATLKDQSFFDGLVEGI